MIPQPCKNLSFKIGRCLFCIAGISSILSLFFLSLPGCVQLWHTPGYFEDICRNISRKFARSTEERVSWGQIWLIEAHARRALGLWETCRISAEKFKLDFVDEIAQFRYNLEIVVYGTRYTGTFIWKVVTANVLGNTSALKNFVECNNISWTMMHQVRQIHKYKWQIQYKNKYQDKYERPEIHLRRATRSDEQWCIGTCTKLLLRDKLHHWRDGLSYIQSTFPHYKGLQCPVIHWCVM